MSVIGRVEKRRVALQADLDGEKTPEDRNRMGQFATPSSLAHEILLHGTRLLPPDVRIHFLDPGIGTGSFYSALRSVVPEERLESATGFEIDPHYGVPAKRFWADTPLKVRMHDFTLAEPRHPRTNLLICNPPYVRHHHLDADTKADLQRRTEIACGLKSNGLSGLYCYFVGLSHKWMAPGGIAGWLIPSEFMSVNYGRMLRRYFLTKVTLLQIHRYDPKDLQFSDALVSSAVVWIKNDPPPHDHAVVFSYGGTLAAPAIVRKVPALELALEAKWTRYPKAEKATVRAQVTLGDLFDIKRGLATGDNSFFIMDREQIAARGLPFECFRPVLPSSRYVPDNEIRADENGLPLLPKQLFLLDTRLPEDQIAVRFPALKAYLDSGRKGERPVASRYLCRSRRPWYAQENRPPAPIVCTYMGRNRSGAKPFRFILNHCSATACNVYLMLYPKPLLARIASRNPATIRMVWEFLNEIDTDELLGHGRVYGGGLHKLEPNELRGFPAEHLMGRLPEVRPRGTQMELL